MEPGSLAIYDTSRPYTLHFDDDFSSHILMFPASHMSVPHEGIRQLTATALGVESQRLTKNVIDILNTLFADELLEGSTRALWSRNQQVLRIKEFIEQHLAEPWLNASAIASAHQMSLRSLYYAFEHEEESVTQFIRSRRLDNAKHDLTDPLQRNIPITTLARRWGFDDPAYFSRVFRKIVGESPTAYRKQHVDTGLPAR